MTTSNPTSGSAGKAISQSEVIARLKIKGHYSAAVVELTREAAAKKSADDLGASVSDDELQAAFDDFRRSLGLNKADETEQWLSGLGIVVEDVEQMLEAAVRRSKIAARLVPDEKVEAYYAENPKEFEFAQVSHIAVRERNVAEEIVYSLKDDGEDFASLAKSHSIDEGSKFGGGFRGTVTRQNTLGLPDDVADRIFSASVGEVIEPFEDGGAYYVCRVDNAGRSPLDSGLKENLREMLLERALAESAGV